jgi:tRNA dimethylallyltransferase
MTEGKIQAVLLAGPTASGKSVLAIEMARRFGGEIINADSMQVYRDLSILTARPNAADLADVRHRLYGHVDGADNHSVGRWREEAAEAIAAVRQAGRLPIMVGGTGLYFRALERGLADMPAVPATIRAQIRQEAEGVETPALHARLARQDEASAARLRPSDRQRILRALEVVVATGRSLASWQDAPHTPPLVEPPRTLRLFLAPDRRLLNCRIDDRFDAMITAGAVEEVRRLAARALDPALPVMRAHGVPWLIRHLCGTLTLEEAVGRAKIDTRHYAKRQVTWFRHQMPGWTFVSPNSACEVICDKLAADAATWLSH